MRAVAGGGIDRFGCEHLAASLDMSCAWVIVGSGGVTLVSLTIEVLYFDGCPHHEALLPHLRELLAVIGVDAEIVLTRIDDAGAAERHRFLGSPTVRINGVDVEPGARRRTDFGLKCRLFDTPAGLRGLPSDEWIVAAARG